MTEIPEDVVIIESAIFNKKGKRGSPSFESKVYNKCGDADIQPGRLKKVDPALIFCSGVPLITNNEFIKEERGIGTNVGNKI